MKVKIENIKDSCYLKNIKIFGFHWVWDNLDYLIKNNLGDNYYLSTWVIGLKYNEGDYFLEHQDDYGDKKDRVLTVVLS